MQFFLFWGGYHLKGSSSLTTQRCDPEGFNLTISFSIYKQIVSIMFYIRHCNETNEAFTRMKIIFYWVRLKVYALCRNINYHKFIQIRSYYVQVFRTVWHSSSYKDNRVNKLRLYTIHLSFLLIYFNSPKGVCVLS